MELWHLTNGSSMPTLPQRTAVALATLAGLAQPSWYIYWSRRIANATTLPAVAETVLLFYGMTLLALLTAMLALHALRDEGPDGSLRLFSFGVTRIDQRLAFALLLWSVGLLGRFAPEAILIASGRMIFM